MGKQFRRSASQGLPQRRSLPAKMSKSAERCLNSMPSKDHAIGPALADHCGVAAGHSSVRSRKPSPGWVRIFWLMHEIGVIAGAARRSCRWLGCMVTIILNQTWRWKVLGTYVFQYEYVLGLGHYLLVLTWNQGIQHKLELLR